MNAAEIALTAGLRGTAQTTVDETNTAQTLGSGSLPVFGTPALLALMERAACRAIAPALGAGMSTVGAELCIRHLAPTPLGMRVTAEATLTDIDGRRLTFTCRAQDETACIAEGTQVRYLIDSARFMEKATAKRG